MIRRDMVHGNLVIVLHQDANATWSDVERQVEELAAKCLDDGKERTVSVVVGALKAASAIRRSKSSPRRARWSACWGGNILRASAAGPVALGLLSRAIGRYC